MIKRCFPALIAVVLVFSIVTLASARGAPNQKAHAVTAAIVDSPVMTAVVPQMTGFDVIQNISTRAIIARTVYVADISASRRLSPTVDWRSRYLVVNRNRPQPCIVLLA